VPVSVEDRRYLPNLCSDQTHAFLRKTCDVDLNVESVVDTPLRNDPPGSEVQILEALEDASECAGVGIGGDSEIENRPILGRHEFGSWQA
jgi:hypothetical protein